MSTAWTVQEWESALSAMTLVLVRISGLMVFAPVFSSAAIPMRMKAAFVLVVSFLLAPVVGAFPRTHVELGVVPLLGELSIGLVLGLTLSLLDEVLRFSGQVMGFQFSFSLVNLLDPNSTIETPLLGQVFGWLGTLVILGAGLHRTLLAALMRTFATAPVGTVTLDPRAGLALVGQAGGIFAAALQLAAPVVAATLLAETAVALAGKLAPQLPVMAIDIPAKTLLGYTVLIGSLALWPHWIEARFDLLLDEAGRLLSGAARGA
jgi:flagellar biosynthesis protein FliR